MKIHLAITAALVLLGLASCALPVATGPAATPPAQKVLSVVLDDPQAAGRAIGTDVQSIAIQVFRSDTGASIGSGTLTKSGSSWSGDVSVKALCPAQVNAYLRGTDGLPLGFGTAPVTITGTGDKVQVTATTSRLLGGSLVSSGFVVPRIPVTSPFAGTGSQGTLDGTAGTARFNAPDSMTTDGTNLYVGDGDRIRRVTVATGQVTTFYQFPTPPAVELRALTCDGTDLYVGTAAGKVYRIPLATGVPTLLCSIAEEVSSLATDGRFLYLAGWNSLAVNSDNYTLCRVALADGTKDTWALTGTLPDAVTALGFDGADLIVAGGLFESSGGGLYRVSRTTGASTLLASFTRNVVHNLVCLGSSVYLLTADFDLDNNPKSTVERWDSGGTSLTAVIGTSGYASSMTTPNYEWWDLTVVGPKMFYADVQGAMIRRIVSGAS